MKTPVNSIVIPKRFVAICKRWYAGMGDMLYAVCSTGNLITGTNRPQECDSDEKWYLTLWRMLSADVYSAFRAAIDDHKDAGVLADFDNYVDDIIERLEREYDLADWDN